MKQQRDASGFRLRGAQVTRLETLVDAASTVLSLALVLVVYVYPLRMVISRFRRERRRLALVSQEDGA